MESLSLSSAPGEPNQSSSSAIWEVVGGVLAVVFLAALVIITILVIVIVIKRSDKAEGIIQFFRIIILLTSMFKYSRLSQCGVRN